MSDKLIITFPTHQAKMVFAQWLSDGGGEQAYVDSCENEGITGIGLAYHGPEVWSATGKLSYGKFLCDNTIRVTKEDE